MRSLIWLLHLMKKWKNVLCTLCIYMYTVHIFCSQVTFAQSAKPRQVRSTTETVTSVASLYNVQRRTGLVGPLSIYSDLMRYHVNQQHGTSVYWYIRTKFDSAQVQQILYRQSNTYTTRNRWKATLSPVYSCYQVIGQWTRCPYLLSVSVFLHFTRLYWPACQSGRPLLTIKISRCQSLFLTRTPCDRLWPCYTKTYIRRFFVKTSSLYRINGSRTI